MSKKTSKPRTPAEKDAAATRTRTRKDTHRVANDARHTDNKQTIAFTQGAADNLLSPLVRGREDAPRTNKGNGSPIRLSQLKRALSRVGTKRKD
jgi:hypothetical protein